MNEIGSPSLVEAVRLWTGWGQGAMPSRNDDRVVNRFGKEVAARLLPVIKSLEKDFYASDAHLVAENLQEMGRLASQHFEQKHPGIAIEIVKAFVWCYTFDFK